MEVLVPRGCGLDVHQATVVACLLTGEPGRLPCKQVRTFSAMTGGLIEMRDWLKAAGCTAVAMEATGVYWQPVYNLLERDFDLVVANARHIKAVPGRKTDVKDAEWIADLLRHGLLRPSYVPPPELRELRALLRYRVKLVNARSAERNRVTKLLERCNIKLSSVASDIFGLSGRLMLDALRHGQADPGEMAELAKGRMRSKLPLLKLALEGQMEAHHRQLLSMQLDRIDRLDRDLARMDAKLEAKLKSYARQMELLDGIPGVNWVTAATVIAEIGTKMSQWPTVGQLTSWAGLCPGPQRECGETG
jgi:transposase